MLRRRRSSNSVSIEHSSRRRYEPQPGVWYHARRGGRDGARYGDSMGALGTQIPRWEESVRKS